LWANQLEGIPTPVTEVGGFWIFKLAGWALHDCPKKIEDSVFL